MMGYPSLGCHKMTYYFYNKITKRSILHERSAVRYNESRKHY